MPTGNKVAQFNAIVSVSDKRGVVEFCRTLVDLKGRILSTGGTAALLEEHDVPVTPIEEVTGYPELLEGRVKSLHPNVQAGILARRNRQSDLEELEEQGIEPIDLVCVNLYPFDEAVAEGLPLEDVLEEIDIGGPTLLRAAAKNFPSVGVVTDPDQYDRVLRELREEEGHLTRRTRRELAAKAFSHTARYDTIIDQYFRHQLLDEDFPDLLNLTWEKTQDLRYGENSHQRAAFYHGKPTSEPAVVNAEQLHGKELSYNNIVDVDTAIEAAKDFEPPTCVIIKHATPSGLASADTIAEAYRQAFACDTYSPFGGIIGLNRTVTREAAEEMVEIFLEVIVAPDFTDDALEVLQEKENLRILKVPGLEHRGRWGGLEYKSVVGGLVVQDRDIQEPDVDAWEVVTDTEPTAEQKESLAFAFRAVRHVKSNSVVFAKGTRTVGIGGGQTSRVDASWIATHKGGEDIDGSVLASDAFFPFRDAVDVAADAGVTAIVQPGGSIRDEEVIEAANEHGIAMVFTGQRAFRH